MSTHHKITPKNFESEITKVLNDYANEVITEIPEAVETAAKRAKKLLMLYAAGQGIGGKRYKKSFSIDKTESTAYRTTRTLYSTQYQLAHLLERGHAIRSKVYRGSSPAYPHWAPTETEAVKMLNDKIIELIEKGK